MDRHAGSVHRYILSLGEGPDDAEDALQETFLAAWRGAANFRGTDSARGWLYAIARNTVRRQHRRRVGEPASFEALETLGAEAGWGTSVDFGAALEAQDELEWALGELNEEEREVIRLRDVHGLSGEETAEALGLSVAGMKSRLHRGRLRLMGIIRSGGGGDV